MEQGTIFVSKTSKSDSQNHHNGKKKKTLKPHPKINMKKKKTKAVEKSQFQTEESVQHGQKEG